MGDDGFGPAVVELLNSNYSLPENIQAIDAGTGVREYLFDYLLSEAERPDELFIIDAVDFNRRNYVPGDILEIDPTQIPAKKIHDFSLHQFPTVNLLQELKEHTGINVRIIAAQVKYIPDEIEPGLTKPMKDAALEASSKIAQILSLNGK